MRAALGARRGLRRKLLLSGLLPVAALVASVAGSARVAPRPANASVVIVARGMLEGQLTPIG
jgi:hypothetical protein